MTNEAELGLLKDRAYSLEKEVGDNDYQIERLMHSLANSGDPGRAIEGLQDYNNRQNGVMFELGKIQAQVEDLENRIREAIDRDQEVALAESFAEGQPIAQEDYLDWLRPSLETPAAAVEPSQDERDPHYEGEERMLQEMEREDHEPEDYLDWWKR